MDASVGAQGPDYKETVDKLKAFLQDFQGDEGPGEHKYMKVLQKVANRELKLVEVELDDIKEGLGEELAETMKTNTHRYKQLIELAIDDVLPQSTGDIGQGDIADVLMTSRSNQANDDGTSDPSQQIPPALKRRHQVVVIPESKEKHKKLRDIKAQNIGQLVSVKGIVTRVSEVKAQIAVATYTCETGGWEVYQEVNDRQFMPLFTCPAANCCNNGRLHLQTRGCKFERFQEVKIQEEADQVCTQPTPLAACYPKPCHTRVS